MKSFLSPPVQTNYQYILEKSKELHYKRSRYPFEQTKQVEYSPKDVATRLHGRTNLIEADEIKECLKNHEIIFSSKLPYKSKKNTPGVQRNRNYNCSFHSYNSFGTKTHAFLNSDGRRMGKVMEDSRNAPLDHSKSINPNFDLIVNPRCAKNPQDNLPPIMTKEKSMIYKVKMHLIKVISSNFTTPQQAFAFFDRKNTGTVDVETMKTVLKQFNIYLSSHQIFTLINLCKFPDHHALIDPALKPCPVVENCVGINERVAAEPNREDTLNFLEFVHFLCVPCQPKLAKEYKSPVMRPNVDKSIYKEDYADYNIKEKIEKLKTQEEQAFKIIYPSAYVRVGLSDDDVTKFTRLYPDLFK